MDYLLHSELVKGQDGYGMSRFFFKPRDNGLHFGRVHAGPVWDLNLILAQVPTFADSTGWHFNSQHDHMYKKLADDVGFALSVAARYKQLRCNVPDRFTHILHHKNLEFVLLY